MCLSELVHTRKTRSKIQIILSNYVKVISQFLGEEFFHPLSFHEYVVGFNQVCEEQASVSGFVKILPSMEIFV